MDALPVELLLEVLKDGAHQDIVAFCNTSRANRALCDQDFWRRRYARKYSVHTAGITDFRRACQQAARLLSPTAYNTYIEHNLNLAVLYAMDNGYELVVQQVLDYLNEEIDEPGSPFKTERGGPRATNVIGQFYFMHVITTKYPYILEQYCQIQKTLREDRSFIIRETIGNGRFIPVANVEIINRYFDFSAVDNESIKLLAYNEIIAQDNIATYDAFPWTSRRREKKPTFSMLAQADAVNLAQYLYPLSKGQYTLSHYLLIVQARARRMLAAYGVPDVSLTNDSQIHEAIGKIYEREYGYEFLINKEYVDPVMITKLAALVTDQGVKEYSTFNFNFAMEHDKKYRIAAALYVELMPRMDAKAIRRTYFTREYQYISLTKFSDDPYTPFYKAVFDMSYTKEPHYMRLVAITLVPLIDEIKKNLRHKYMQYLFRVLNAYYLQQIPDYESDFNAWQYQYRITKEGVILPPGSEEGSAFIIRQLAPELQ